MKQHILTLIAVLASLSLFGQIKEFKARLVNQGTDIPITFQEIVVYGGLEYTTFTDSNGDFTIPAAKESYLISILREGYHEMTIQLSIDMPYCDI